MHSKMNAAVTFGGHGMGDGDAPASLKCQGSRSLGHLLRVNFKIQLLSLYCTFKHCTKITIYSHQWELNTVIFSFIHSFERNLIVIAGFHQNKFHSSNNNLTRFISLGKSI